MVIRQVYLIAISVDYIDEAGIELGTLDGCCLVLMQLQELCVWQCDDYV